jgi:hypothetical protein
MKSPVARLVAGGLAATFFGCAPTYDVEPGAPRLLGLQLLDPTGSPIELDPDAGAQKVTPRVRVMARFDRLLDPASIEAVVDGGLVGRAGVATLEAPGSPTVEVAYVPNGHPERALLLPPGPGVRILPGPTLPSGAQVTISIDRTKIRAKDRNTTALLAEGARDRITFETTPFSATLQLPGADRADAGAAPAAVAEDFVAPIAFSNLVAADVAGAVNVVATGPDGRPVDGPLAEIALDEHDPALLKISPRGGAWPAGATVTITVGADAADALGVKISAPLSGAFTVRPRP